MKQNKLKGEEKMEDKKEEKENKPFQSTDNNFIVIPYEDTKRLVITTPTGSNLELNKSEAKVLMAVIQDCIQNW